MPTNYPAGYDQFPNPIGSDLLSSQSVPHAKQHADANDAIEALQAKLGLGNQVTIVDGTGPSLFQRDNQALQISNSTLGADIYSQHTRKMSSDGAVFKAFKSLVTGNVVSLSAFSNNPGGVYSNELSMMDGRYGFNLGANVVPDDTLIIRSRTGNELGRFSESGQVTLTAGTASTALMVKVRGQASYFPLSVSPLGTANVTFTSGGEWLGSSLTARNPTATQLEQINDSFRWYADSGLTSGATWSRTLRMSLSSDNKLTLPVLGASIAIGGVTNGPLAVYGDNPTLQGNQASFQYRRLNGFVQGSVGYSSTYGTNLAYVAEAGNHMFVTTLNNVKTERVRIAPDGIMRVNGTISVFGRGALDSVGVPRVAIGDFGDPNTVAVVGNKEGGATTHIVLRATGAGSNLHLQRDGANFLVGLTAPSGHTMVGVPGFIAAGSTNGQPAGQDGVGHPAFRVARITDILNGNGGTTSRHFLSIVPQQILVAQSWYRGNSGEYSPLRVDAVDSFTIYTSTGLPHLVGRRVVHTIVYADTAAPW